MLPNPHLLSFPPPHSTHHRLPLLTITQTIPPPPPPPKPAITPPPALSRTPRPRAQPRNRMKIRLRASTILRPPSLALRPCATITITAKVNRRGVAPAALLMGVVLPWGGLPATCWCRGLRARLRGVGAEGALRRGGGGGVGVEVFFLLRGHGGGGFLAGGCGSFERVGGGTPVVVRCGLGR